jgi:hypothetical protein
MVNAAGCDGDCVGSGQKEAQCNPFYATDSWVLNLDLMIVGTIDLLTSPQH